MENGQVRHFPTIIGSALVLSVLLKGSVVGFLQVYTFGVRWKRRETCPKSAHNRLTGISAPVDATHKSAPGLTVLKIFNTIISLNLSIRHYNTLKKSSLFE